MPLDNQFNNDTELSKDGILDILNEESDDKSADDNKLKIEIDDDINTEKSDDEGEEEKKEDREKDKKTEEDEEELDESKFELAVPARKKEILKAYPDLFKKFPYLEVAYYRDQQFTEIVPTIEAAKEAVEKSQLLDNVEGQLLSGNTEELLRAVKDEDPEAFNRIADNYLTTLSKVDEKAYLNVVGNVIKYTIISMVREGRAKNNEELINQAKAINEFVFGTVEFTNPTNLAKPKTEDDTIKKERENFNRERFETVLTDLQGKVDNIITSTIDANIDPKNSMSPYVKKNAIKDVSSKLEDLINGDRRFKGLLDNLWKSAAADRYSKSTLDKIRSAYLSKARTLLPGVIKAARNEALRGLGKKEKDDDDNKDRRGPISVGRTSTSGKSGNTKMEIPKGMSNKDFLMSD